MCLGELYLNFIIESNAQQSKVFNLSKNQIEKSVVYNSSFLSLKFEEKVVYYSVSW